MTNIYFSMSIFFILSIFYGVAPAYGSKEKESRTKIIDFESEVVEGMNKKPLDSLSHVSDQDKKRKRPHLYKKRAGFRNETKETLRNMRYVQ